MTLKEEVFKSIQIRYCDGYGLDSRGSIPGRPKRVFSLLHCVQTGSGAHLASCTVCAGGSFFGVKAV
jgi:hypothetical protein